MKRRLIAPTAVIALVCLLLVQHQFFGEHGWTVIAFLLRVLSIVVEIFTPPEPVVSFFVEYLALPTAVLGVGILVLWLCLVRARQAMRQVTPDAEMPVWDLPAVAEPEPVPVPESQTAPALTWALRSFRFNCLRSKLILSFIAISMLITIAAGSVTYSILYRAAKRGAIARADIALTALSASAAAHLGEQRYQDLRRELAHALSRPTVAYIYVEDQAGNLIAHAPKDLASHLVRPPPPAPGAIGELRQVKFLSDAVYDFSRESPADKRFILHLGIWQDSIASETWSVLGPIFLFILLLMFAAAGAFVTLLRTLHRPLLELVEQSDRISKGDFSVTLALQRPDELGELARSMERLRASLRMVLARFETDTPASQSSHEG